MKKFKQVISNELALSRHSFEANYFNLFESKKVCVFSK